MQMDLGTYASLIAFVCLICMYARMLVWPAWLSLHTHVHTRFYIYKHTSNVRMQTHAWITTRTYE